MIGETLGIKPQDTDIFASPSSKSRNCLPHFTRVNCTHVLIWSVSMVDLLFICYCRRDYQYCFNMKLEVRNQCVTGGTVGMCSSLLGPKVLEEPLFVLEFPLNMVPQTPLPHHFRVLCHMCM